MPCIRPNQFPPLTLLTTFLESLKFSSSSASCLYLGTHLQNVDGAVFEETLVRGNLNSLIHTRIASTEAKLP